nr:hypothetical protein Q903MT_gene4985 [Picea sitchensis]
MPTQAYYLRACHPLGAAHSCLPSCMPTFLMPSNYLGAILLSLAYLDQARHNTLLTSMPGSVR